MGGGAEANRKKKPRIARINTKLYGKSVGRKRTKKHEAKESRELYGWLIPIAIRTKPKN